MGPPEVRKVGLVDCSVRGRAGQSWREVGRVVSCLRVIQLSH